MRASAERTREGDGQKTRRCPGSWVHRPGEKKPKNTDSPPSGSGGLPTTGRFSALSGKTSRPTSASEAAVAAEEARSDAGTTPAASRRANDSSLGRSSAAPSSAPAHAGSSSTLQPAPRGARVGVAMKPPLQSLLPCVFAWVKKNPQAPSTATGWPGAPRRPGRRRRARAKTSHVRRGIVRPPIADGPGHGGEGEREQKKNQEVRSALPSTRGERKRRGFLCRVIAAPQDRGGAPWDGSDAHPERRRP